MFAGLEREEISAALDAVAMTLLDAAGIDRPPVDAFRLARALGITLAEDDRQQGRARYVRLGGRRVTRPTILLRHEPRRERRQWAVAHEIGEHAAHRVFALLGVEPCETAPAAREAAANHLAGRLLLPGDWFALDAPGCRWDLLQLKARYTTASHELIARRMLECPPPVIITIFDHGELYFRRSNLPGRAPSPSATEMECWRAVHATGRSRQTYEELRSVHGWPVHECGWKREILRTEVEEITIGV